MGVRSDPFHLAGRFAAVLASETDADAEDDYGGPLSVQLPWVGWQVWHRERPGKNSCPFGHNYEVKGSISVVENECAVSLLCFADIQAAGGGSSIPFDCWTSISTSLLQGIPEREHATLQSQEDIQGEFEGFCNFYWQLIFKELIINSIWAFHSGLHCYKCALLISQKLHKSPEISKFSSPFTVCLKRSKLNFCFIYLFIFNLSLFATTTNSLTGLRNIIR